MQIEVGKSYRTRDGRRVDITDIDDHPHYPVNGDFVDEGVGGSWPLNGGHDESDAGDLVAEWDEPAPSAAVSAPAVLEQAAQHMRDRAATYDAPGGERSMAKTVAIFNLHHDMQMTEAQGWHFMAVLKQVRAFQRDGYHADSFEDLAAYVALTAEARAAS